MFRKEPTRAVGASGLLDQSETLNEFVAMNHAGCEALSKSLGMIIYIDR